jgi:hypothetical protein
MLQLLSAALHSGLCFFQFPLPATPTVVLADALAPEPGRSVGFTMLVSNDTNDLAPAFTPAVFGVRVFHAPGWHNRLRCHFGWEPVSIFGSRGITVPAAVHLGWTYHSACPSDRIDARSR